MEKILVLMSTYNGEKYLQEQLNSLYSQENAEVFILVRDDGSTDGTIEILNRNIENYDNIKLAQDNKGNLGVAKSFFEIMKEAAKTSHTYFAFCDQDDIWDRDKLSKAMDKLKDQKGPALYYSGQRLVDENGKMLEEHKLNFYRTLKTRFVLSDFAGCTGVFNRQLLEEIVRFEPEYMLMHDTWALRVCLCIGGNVFPDVEPSMSYRQHSGNMIGLKPGIRGKIRNLKKTVFDYKIKQVTDELLRGYGDHMTAEYYEMARRISTYKEEKASRKALLDRKNVDFCRHGLNFAYRLKIHLRKL